MRTRKYFTAAALLFATELVLGTGLIGIVGGIVGAVVVILSAETIPALRQRTQLAALFLTIALATFGWLGLNARVAKQNAITVIAACKRFRSEHGRYPSALNQLVPNQLPSLPPARYTVAARKFVYGPEPPELCFAAMFHGVFCYNFQADSWTAND
jgi:hypothetical protein